MTDAGGTCVARQMCSAADAGLSCAAPAIKDNTGMCADKQCNGAVDFGDASKACCMDDVCNAAAKATCRGSFITQHERGRGGKAE